MTPALANQKAGAWAMMLGVSESGLPLAHRWIRTIAMSRFQKRAAARAQPGPDHRYVAKHT